MDELFQGNVQAVGDAVDVVEVADDLGGIVDGPVGEAMLAQGFYVGIGDLSRGVGELFGVGAEGLVGWGERGRVPIFGYLVNQ